jgi:chemotaxis signal transduction protein
MRLFAVYADEVEATSENLTPTPLPFAPAPVRGVVSQRGRIFTVIDPLLLLQPDAAPTGAPADAPALAPLSMQTSTPFIVALRGDEQLALSVERIEHELEFFDDEADAPASSLLRRTIRHQTGDIALLDPAHLFDAAMKGVERRRRRT